MRSIRGRTIRGAYWRIKGISLILRGGSKHTLVSKHTNLPNKQGEEVRVRDKLRKKTNILMYINRRF